MSQIVRIQPLLKDKEATKFNDFIRHSLKTHFPIKTVFRKMSPVTFDIYEYMLNIDHPVTALDLRKTYGQLHSDKSIYRILKNLRELGLVACAGHRYENKMKDEQFIKSKKRIALWVAV